MSASENPFRVSRVHALRFRWPADLDVVALTRRWESCQRRGAICGPHGNGKSTLLSEWAEHLHTLGWRVQRITLTEEFPRIAPALLRKAGTWGPETVVLLDGAEQLGPLAWRRWLWATRQVGGQAITLHQPSRLPLLAQLGSSPHVLRELLEELLDGDLRLLPCSPEELLRQHGGDVRRIFRALYDAWRPGSTILNPAQT